MSGRDETPFDEFDWIDQDLKPLADGAPEALGLQDDAAIIPGRPGFDLVVTKDAIVAGVHFLPDDPADLIARKLLRVNLSDLAAKGAAPYGYFLAIAWPNGTSRAERRAFAQGLRQDQETFGLRLMGGDTVATPGPLTASATVLGWVPTGAAVKRSGAKAGDLLLVSGTVGDGGLGLRAAQGALPMLDGPSSAWLADRYRVPAPRTGLAGMLSAHAHASADVSDGLIADAGHIASASGVGITIDLDSIPLSQAAQRWLGEQSDRMAGLVDLATAGDDYEIVCTADSAAAPAMIRAASAEHIALTAIGRVTEGRGVRVLYGGEEVAISRSGYRHG